MGVADAALEAEVLIRHALGIDRARFLSTLDDGLGAAVAGALRGLAERRCAREPLAYITGRREFYGMELRVSRDVLIPRQETELLVDLALERIASARSPRVVDAGTGSGCIALAIAANCPGADVHAVDSSQAALEVAARNRSAHGLEERVILHLGDMLPPGEGGAGPFDVIVSNPPYVPSAVLARLSPEVRAEPAGALDGGPDGLEPTRRLLGRSRDALSTGGVVLVEVFSEGAERALSLAREAFPGSRVSLHADLLGEPRVLEVAGEGAG